MIVSISGMDGLGKSTQADILSKRMPQFFTKPLHINQSPSFPKLEKNELAKWWFNPENKEEFVDTIFACVSERFEEAKKLSESGINVVLDKGYDFYLTRVKATLLSYGTSTQETERLILNAIEKYQLNTKQENLKLIIIPPKDYKGIKRAEEQFTETEIIYDKYNKLNVEILNKKINDANTFVPVEYIYGEPEKMTQSILKLINSYNPHPILYQNIVDSVVEHAKETFQDNLKMVILAGSSVKGHFLENWSDLDFYVVLKDIKKQELNKFTQKTDQLDLHVGTTFYTLGDLSTPLRVDKRTMVTFYEINIGKNKVLYNPDNLKIPYIDFKQISETEESNVAEILNEIKRLVYFDDFNAKKFIKKITVLEKIVLRSKGFLTESYQDTMQLFSQVYKTPYIDVPSLIKQDLNSPEMVELLQNYGDAVLRSLETEKKEKNLKNMGESLER